MPRRVPRWAGRERVWPAPEAYVRRAMSGWLTDARLPADVKLAVHMSLLNLLACGATASIIGTTGSGMAVCCPPRPLDALGSLEAKDVGRLECAGLMQIFAGILDFIATVVLLHLVVGNGSSFGIVLWASILAVCGALSVSAGVSCRRAASLYLGGEGEEELPAMPRFFVADAQEEPPSPPRGPPLRTVTLHAAEDEEEEEGAAALLPRTSAHGAGAHEAGRSSSAGADGHGQHAAPPYAPAAASAAHAAAPELTGRVPESRALAPGAPPVPVRRGWEMGVGMAAAGGADAAPAAHEGAASGSGPSGSAGGAARAADSTSAGREEIELVPGNFPARGPVPLAGGRTATAAAGGRCGQVSPYSGAAAANELPTTAPSSNEPRPGWPSPSPQAPHEQSGAATADDVAPTAAPSEQRCQPPR